MVEDWHWPTGEMVCLRCGSHQRLRDEAREADALSVTGLPEVLQPVNGGAPAWPLGGPTGAFPPSG